MRKLSVFLLLPVLAIAAFVSARRLRSHASKSSTAYSIQYLSTVTHTNGVQVVTEHRFVARRGDGSRVEGFVVDGVPGFEPTITKRLFMTDTGTEVFVHGLSKSVSTTRMKRQEVKSLELGPSDPSCLSSRLRVKQPEYVGHAQVLGFKVVKLLTSFDKQVSIEEWESPALNCEPLYTKVHDGSGRGLIELKALSVKLGQPDASLFEIPDGSRERSPSEIMNMAVQLQGVPVERGTADRLKNLDAHYKANRP